MTMSMVQLLRDVEQWRAEEDPEPRLREWLADPKKHVLTVLWALEDPRVTPAVEQHGKLGGWYRTARWLLDVQTVDRDVVRRLRGLPAGLRQWILWQWARTDRPASFWQALFQHEEVLRWVYQWAQKSVDWRFWAQKHLEQMPARRLRRKLEQLVGKPSEYLEAPDGIQPVTDSVVYAIHSPTGRYYWFLFYTLPSRSDWLMFCLETVADLRVERALTTPIPEEVRNVARDVPLQENEAEENILQSMAFYAAFVNPWFFPPGLWEDVLSEILYETVPRERAYMWLRDVLRKTPWEQWPVRLRAYYARLLQSELEREEPPEIQKVRTVLEQQTIPLHTPPLAFASHKAALMFLEHLYALMVAYRSPVEAERFVDWVADIARDRTDSIALDAWLHLHGKSVVAPSPPALDDALRRAFAKAYLLVDTRSIDATVLEVVEWIANWTLMDLQKWILGMQQ